MEITGSNSVEESWKLDNVLEQRLREVNHDSVKTNLQVRKCVCVRACHSLGIICIIETT